MTDNTPQPLDLEAIRARADAVIEQAPHGDNCWLHEDPDEGVLSAHRICTCWKSVAPSDALAKVKREAAADALDDALHDWSLVGMQLAQPAAFEMLKRRAAAIREGRS